MDPTILDLLARSPGAAIALDAAAKATLVLAATATAALAMRRSSAAARHLAWCLGLGGALMLPVLSLALPGWDCRILPAGGAEGDPAPIATAHPPAPRPSRMLPVSSPLDETAFEEDDLPGAAPATRIAARPTPDPSWQVPAPSWSWLWAAWLAGTVVILSTPLAGRIALRRLMRDAQPIDGDDWIALLGDLSARLGLSRRIGLLRSARAAMPMTWGWLRPVILLPAGADSWSIDRRRDVLLHELAHVQRLDCLTQWIARAACALYWFNPLAWYAARRMRVERERACDDVVLMAGARASEYAGHLLEIARGLRAPRTAALAALAMARPSQLEGRLVAILDPDRRRRGPGRRAATLATLAAVLLLLPLAMLHLGARASAAQEPIAAKSPAADPAARMTVNGRVLDPAGKPVPDAVVMVLEQPKSADRRTLHPMFFPMTAGHDRCDGSGRFRVELPRTSSARHDRLVVTAMAPGFGIGWTDLDPDADPPTADIALRTEQVIRGRIFDVQGQPAGGVALWVRAVHTVARQEISIPIFRPDFMEPPWHELPGWPGPAKSGDDGRFTLRGMGPEVEFQLLTHDPRYSLPPTFISTSTHADPRAPGVPFPAIKVEPGPDARPIKITVQPARTIVGRVTYADTGQPVPHALVTVGQQRYAADGQGRFRAPFTPMTVRFDRFSIDAQAPAPGPYLIAATQGEWPKGAVEQSVDLALARGTVIHGKITEEGTGVPVAGAVVWVTPEKLLPGPSRDLPGFAVTDSDGTYRIASPQGPCYLTVQGSDEYVPREIGGGPGMSQRWRRRDRLYAHASRAIDVKPGGPDECDLALRRGATVRGRVLDPDGRPVRDAWFYSRVVLKSAPTGGWRRWYIVDDRDRGHVRDGRFAIHGLDPAGDIEVPVSFLEPDRKLGATARFSARAAVNGEVTVRLERCGMAMARLVGPDGKPLDRYPAGGLVSMVVTPGPPFSGRAAKDGPLFADESVVARIDPVHYGPDFQSDAQGRVTWPVLIPGASYRIVDNTPAFGGGEPEIRREFVVGAGEAAELGDVLVARPQRRNGQ